MTWKTEEHYFSGQGQVLLAARDSVTGKPLGLKPLGNVSALKIALATTVISHKESQTGSRGVDKRLTTEINCTLTMTVDNFNNANLATTLRADAVLVQGVTVADLPILMYSGSITAVGPIDLVSLTLKEGAEVLTPYVDDATPYDYLVNLKTGSIFLNDGALVNLANLGTHITNVTLGASTVFTATHSFTVGQKVTFLDLLGDDAGLFNGKTFTVSAVTGTTAFTVAVDSTGKLIEAGDDGAYLKGVGTFLVSYTSNDNYVVDAMTNAADEVYMRFEGLNTAEDNDPVIVEVFKFSSDPLKELNLISDAFQTFDLEGSVLADLTRTVGSKYFKITKTA